MLRPGTIKETVLAIALISFAALFVWSLFFQSPRIEKRLQEATNEKLEGGGFEEVVVEFKGRNAIVTGQVSSEAKREDLHFLIDSIYGVEEVDLRKVNVASRGTMIPRTEGFVGEIGRGLLKNDGWIYLSIQMVTLLAISAFIGFLLGLAQVFGRNPSRKNGVTEPGSVVSVAYHQSRMSEADELIEQARQRYADMEEEVLAIRLELETLQQEHQKVADKEATPQFPMEEEESSGVAEPTTDRDNLEELKGVGSVLAAKLNEAGVYTFQQIASWSEEDKDSFAKAVKGLRGPLNRYDLVAQAQEKLRGPRKTLRATD